MSNLKNTRLGRAETLDNLMGRDGPGREKLKMSYAGSGRGPSSEKSRSRAGPRPIL